MIANEANLIHSHTPIQLTISTDALVLKRLNDSQIVYSHKMEGISFASAGEHVRFCCYFFSEPISMFDLRIQKII